MLRLRGVTAVLGLVGGGNSRGHLILLLHLYRLLYRLRCSELLVQVQVPEAFIPASQDYTFLNLFFGGGVGF
jgi:hypothetical protein